MRGVQLQHVEAGTVCHFRRRDELIAHLVHVGARHGARGSDYPWTTARLRPKEPASCRRASGTSVPSQPTRVEPFAPECPSWQQIFASVSAWTKSAIRFHAASCSGAYMPVQPGVDTSFRTDAGHLDGDHARATLGAFAVMHEMPVIRRAVHRLVLGHW